MKKLILFLSALLVFIPFKVDCHSQPPKIIQQCAFNGINYKNAVDFVKELQAAIKFDDRLKAANLVDYPLRVNFSMRSGKKYRVGHKNIVSKAQFIRNYDGIFTQEFKIKILQQDPANIFCNYQGAMIAEGGIWFTTKNKGVRIIAVNIS